jgi:hypothetical protein
MSDACVSSMGPRRMGPCVRRDDARRFDFQTAGSTRQEAIHRAAKKVWIASSQVLLAMTSRDTASRSRGLFCPSFARNLLTLRSEGAGNTGCALHPRSAQKNAREHTGSAEAIRHSPRNGLRLISCSPATGLSCHHRPRCLARDLHPCVPWTRRRRHPRPGWRRRRSREAYCRSPD